MHTQTQSLSRVGRRRTRTFAAWGAALPTLFVVGLANAGTVTGRVVGDNGAPRPYVRVEFYGPQGATICTDADGRFSIDLAKGSYVVQLIQSDKAHRLSLVTESGPVNQFFKLSW